MPCRRGRCRARSGAGLRVESAARASRARCLCRAAACRRGPGPGDRPAGAVRLAEDPHLGLRPRRDVGAQTGKRRRRSLSDPVADIGRLPPVPHSRRDPSRARCQGCAGRGEAVEERADKRRRSGGARERPRTGTPRPEGRTRAPRTRAQKRRRPGGVTQGIPAPARPRRRYPPRRRPVVRPARLDLRRIRLRAGAEAATGPRPVPNAAAVSGFRGLAFPRRARIAAAPRAAMVRRGTFAPQGSAQTPEAAAPAGAEGTVGGAGADLLPGRERVWQAGGAGLPVLSRDHAGVAG